MHCPLPAHLHVDIRTANESIVVFNRIILAFVVEGWAVQKVLRRTTVGCILRPKHERSNVAARAEEVHSICHAPQQFESGA